MATRTMAMVAKEGDMAPMVTFKCRVRDEKIGGDNPFTWKDVTSADLFKGKRAVIFALPGGNTKINTNIDVNTNINTNSFYSNLFINSLTWL